MASPCSPKAPIPVRIGILLPIQFPVGVIVSYFTSFLPTNDNINRIYLQFRK